MEVERIQDGPLKKSEIARFLAASKTAFKTVDNILTEKKEPSFQQRTLIDIASETKIRNEIASTDADLNDSNEHDANELTPEDEQEQELATAKRIEEEENLRIIEEKKIQDAKVAQEEKEKELFEKGFAEGREASDRVVQEKLENGLMALENARKSILDLNASHFINLRQQIISQILNLSSERAASAIKDLPDKFISKIETLLESVGQVASEPVIFLNPDDLNAIQDSTSIKKETLGFSFESREGLKNGDIIIEIGSISIMDTATERSELARDREHSQDKEKEEDLSTKDSSKNQPHAKPSGTEDNEGTE